MALIIKNNNKQNGKPLNYLFKKKDLNTKNEQVR